MFTFSDHFSADETAGGRVYRIRTDSLIAALLCTAFFIVWGVVSTLAAAFDWDGSFGTRSVAFAAVSAVFWSGWALLGIWCIVTCLSYRLHVCDHFVQSTSCWRKRRIVFANLTRAVWRVFPAGGSLVLRDECSRLVVGFGEFLPQQRMELIAFFHERLREEVQEKWDRFEPHFSSSPEARKRSSCATRVLYACFVLSGVGFACFGVITRDFRHFIPAVVLVACGSWLAVSSWRSSARGKPSDGPG